MSSSIDSKYKYLSKINFPADLKKLPETALQAVCDEVREFMIETITQTGGHFGAGLGVIELTVALHYIFNTPDDKIVFDTGHQGYPHKILTGRKELLHTIRQKGGLSGFLKPAESEYDAFGAGHASTSISSALGLATARDILKKNNRVVAVIGDGAMTGGLAFEAMNNCGVQGRDITVILNDNNLSINSNVSAISNYFNELFASSQVQKLRENIWNITGKMDEFGDRIRKVASRLEGSVKTFITPGMLFEAFGFNYFGPINGHNIKKLVRILGLVKDIHGPVLLHIITEKGKGYGPAENDEQKFHAIGKINKETGELIKKVDTSSPAYIPNYLTIFGDAMVEICKIDSKVVGITAAMADGTGLDILSNQMPERVFDVGIAEGHAVTYASGMAIEGVIPVVAIYSTFLQRAFDHITHDCSLQKLHIVFAIDRAGLVGEDGPTHHGVMDISFLRTVPNMIVMAPKDEQELRNLLFSAVTEYKDGPSAIRYPRGKGTGTEIKPFKAIPLGKWEVLKNGEDVAILAVGKMVSYAVKAAEILKEKSISCHVVNCRFIKPLDTEMLDSLFGKFDKFITLEDGQKSGGFGSAVLEYIAGRNYKNKTVNIHGIPDKFIEHATQDELFHDLMLDTEGIVSKIEQMF